MILIYEGHNMKTIRTISLLVACAIVLPASLRAEESGPRFTPGGPSRGPASYADRVDPVYEEPGTKNTYQHIRNKDGYDGARVQFYYDPLSSYSKLVTNGGLSANQFGYSSISGNMGGVQALWSVWAPSDFEFQTGLDYVFPVSVQGAQTAFGSYSVTEQTLNVAGFKVLQVGYRINLADFILAPYGGAGVYYGKNSLTMQYAGTAQSNIINYTKLMMMYTAGARFDYSFNRRRTIAAGVGFEFFVPTKITDQISQNGSQAAQLAGSESYLQANMDFMTGIGARLYAGVAGYF